MTERTREELALGKVSHRGFLDGLNAAAEQLESEGASFIAATIREAARRLREQGERIEGWVPAGKAKDRMWSFVSNEHVAVVGTNAIRATLIIDPQEPEGHE